MTTWLNYSLTWFITINADSTCALIEGESGHYLYGTHKSCPHLTTFCVADAPNPPFALQCILFV